MENIKPIRMCYSQKVIPLAFDESMSYYEQICRIKAKMNELISFFNNELTQELKEYIEKEFENIMLDTIYDAETETLIMYINRGEE